MAVTIKDVAKLANVSTSTVSRVISNNSKISSDTKARVFEAIKTLGYHPNEIARSLANNSANVLGLILPNNENDLFNNPFFILLMKGISVYAQKKGYNIMYSFSKDENEEIDIIKKYTYGKAVDGIILLRSNQNDKCIKYLKEIDYPFVVVGRPENPENILWVDNDNYNAMFNVVSGLIYNEKKQIAFIGASPDMNMSKDRLAGYKKALEDHGIPFDERLTAEGNEFSEQNGYELMQKILKYKKPDAVTATDDLLALGAIKALKEIYSVNDISIVGFNNIPQAEYKYSRLSSVDINSEELGKSAAKLLINKLLRGNEILVNHLIIETRFVDRENFIT